MYVKLKVAGYKPYKEEIDDSDLDDVEKLIRESKIELSNAQKGVSEKFEIFELESVDRLEEYAHTNEDEGVGTTINIWLTTGDLIGPFEMCAQEFLSVASNTLCSAQDFEFYRGAFNKTRKP